MNLDTNSEERTRPGAADRGRAAVAHALEHVAEAAGSPVSAEQALRAVSRCHPDGLTDLNTASNAATELGLTSRHLPPNGHLNAHPPALARLEEGRWLVVGGRRGRRFDVAFVTARGVNHQTLTSSALNELLDGLPLLHFEPLLGLEKVSTHNAPQLVGHPWRRLRTFLGLERGQLVVVGAYATVIGVLSLATPIAVQAVVSSVAFGSTLQPLVVLALLLFGGMAFSGLLSVVEAYVVEVLQRRVFVRVADDFGRRIPAVPARVHDDVFAPDLVNRFFDVITIQKSLSTLLLDSLSLALQTGAGMLLLGFYHPLLLAFDVVLLLVLFGVFALGRGAVPSAARESKAKYRVAAWLEDMARAPRLFRSTSAREHAWSRTDLLARDYLGARRTHFRVLLRQLGGGVGLQVLAVVALLGVGGYLVMKRQLTIGQLVAAELIVTAMGAAFAKLGKHLEKLYDLNVGVLKVGRVLDLPLERRGGERIRPEGPLRIRAHSLSIGRGEQTLVRNADLELQAGARVLLQGSSGCGKSTLLDVLEGSRDALEGSVQINGLDLRRADLGSVREHVITLGLPAFVQGSILDNLSPDGVQLPEPQTRRLLALVDLEDTIDRMPRGLDAIMSPTGSPFSEQQQRRLALVRALAHHPKALLIDRSLDGLGLDDHTYARLLDYVFRPEAPWTLLVVSDDARVQARCTSTIRIANRTVEVTR